jgi:hypothetical protein
VAYFGRLLTLDPNAVVKRGVGGVGGREAGVDHN